MFSVEKLINKQRQQESKRVSLQRATIRPCKCRERPRANFSVIHSVM